MLFLFYKYKKIETNVAPFYLFSSEFYIVYLFSAALYSLHLELGNCDKFYFTFKFEYQMWVQNFQRFM